LDSKEINFELKSVVKPHSSKITCIAISGDGRNLVSACEEGDVFFLNVNSNAQIEPIGFLKFTSCPVSISFMKNDKVLMIFNSGKIMECKFPNILEVDTEFSYLLKEKKFELKNFVVNVSEDTQRAEAIGLSAFKVIQAEGKCSETVENEPWKIKSTADFDKGLFGAFYSSMLDQDQFLAGMNINGYGEIRVFSLKNNKISRLIQRVSNPLNCIKLTKQYLYFGTSKGDVYIKKIDTEKLFIPDAWTKGHQDLIKPVFSIQTDKQDTPDDNCWFKKVHDSEYGAVISIIPSFDNHFVGCAGEDNGFFVWKNNSGEIHAETNKNIELKVGCQDITNSNTYSVQERKIQEEKDRELLLAKEKKVSLRAEINGIREAFLEVISMLIKGSSRMEKFSSFFG
jgi:WD40 repeat protein